MSYVIVLMQLMQDGSSNINYTYDP